METALGGIALMEDYMYRIVASTNTCYYSENQIFYSLE